MLAGIWTCWSEFGLAAGAAIAPDALNKCHNHLVGRANTGQKRERLFKRKTVVFGVLACTSVLDNHEAKSETSALTRR